MKKRLVSFLLALLTAATPLLAKSIYKPWSHGRLIVSENQRYLQHEDGTPFFYMGETGWLMPERLNRAEVSYYLSHCRKAGYNVVQVQTVDDVPAINCYGQLSHPYGYDFKKIDQPGVYGYWDHMDYIIETAERNGIYIGMVCIWGNLVKDGLMTVDQAKSYGKFLAERYKDAPNIIWIIGGDIRGDVKTAEWDALAEAISKYDPDRIMTYHPRGRTTSTMFFNDREWLDFNMFQSGHRRYGQRNGDGDYTIDDNTEEDNWRYVDKSLATQPMKPVLDAEPIYEDIPQGLHDITQPRWNAADCRRYAYWSVFAGSCGHAYGHNSIMQFHRPGMSGSFGPEKAWYDALKDPGFNQMKYVKNLMLTFPYFDRVPAQEVVKGVQGERYDRVVATRGKDYILAYNATGRPMHLDLTTITGAKKKCWWYFPTDGTLSYLGEYDNGADVEFVVDAAYGPGYDRVLIVMDASKDYVREEWKELPEVKQ